MARQSIATRQSIAKWCALSLSLFVLWTVPAQAQTISPSVTVSSFSQSNLDPQTVIKQLAKSRVIYLGETHDSKEDHDAQMELIKALHAQNPKLAIGMEMFQRPFQSGLDRYLAGALTEEMLREFTEYDKRWGFPWEFYAPIIAFAKDNKLPVIALNTPTEVTRKVSREGLDSLTVEEKRYIPPIAEIRLEPDRYRDRLREIFDSFHHRKGNNRGFDRFFQAQVLWDETMAEAIVQFLKQNPDRQIIVLVGQGHVVYGDGIPSRVARRMPKIQQSTVLLNPSEEMLRESAIADYFWKNRPN
ncbi:MAG: ChaN family lipoprotein [Leptolyngbya sp. Prado105]|nr:ChaN family lipoprotein [Leptolyngbya sp. Prado105]